MTAMAKQSGEQYAAGGGSGVTMRRSRILEVTRGGGIARMLKVNTSCPRVVEMFSLARPDGLWLGHEHVPNTWEQLENQIRAAKVYDVDTVVRVARGSYSDYIRPLEMDATGLMVPHVMDLDDAVDVRNMTKFPPLGKRACDGGNADCSYCHMDFVEYLKVANEERFVIYQIEDPEALPDLEAIAELPGVDAILFGAGDFSVAIGHPGEVWHPEVTKVRERIAEVVRKNNKIAGATMGLDKVKAHVDMGYNLINVSGDVFALKSYAEKAMAVFDEL
jgi:4-hydroxy-2-oxoheptanedioate aldolase